uniref:Uncharacterized protein n=1 Tax=Glossina austeni TaxID=7395 RepID=A0A1A9V5F9_GLOAU
MEEQRNQGSYSKSFMTAGKSEQSHQQKCCKTYVIYNNIQFSGHCANNILQRNHYTDDNDVGDNNDHDDASAASEVNKLFCRLYVLAAYVGIVYIAKQFVLNVVVIIVVL